MDIVAEPGERLDANGRPRPVTGTRGAYAEAGEGYLMGEGYHRVPLPRYSTNIEDAHRVMATMKGLHLVAQA